MYHYHAFGYHIISEIECPELLPAAGEFHTADISIAYGKVPAALASPLHNMRIGETTDTESIMRIQDVADFYICEGRQIVVEPKPQSDPGIIRLYLLGSCFGLVFHQRKVLPLHASAVCVNGKAVLFTGRSQAGKSSTAHAFVQKGYALHADDICVVRFEEGVPRVYPGYPQMKMWGDALDHHGISRDNLREVQTRTEKYALPMRSEFNRDPLPLDQIFLLRPDDVNEIEIKRLTGMRKFSVARNNTYRYRLMKAMGLAHDHFVHLTSIMKDIPVHVIVRPKDRHTLNELVLRLERDMF